MGQAWRAVVSVMVGLSLVAVSAFAVRADTALGLTGGATALDLAVGLAFPAAAIASRCPARQRWLLGAVGPAWLAASASPNVIWMHRVLLALALLAFPTGRLRGRTRRFGSVVVVLGIVGSQVATAAMFLSVAALHGWSERSTRGLSRWYPIAVAGLVAAEQLAAAAAYSWSPAELAPEAWLVLYEATLVTAAVAHIPAARAATSSRTRPLDKVLVARLREPVSRWDQLTTELREALGDRRLNVYRWDSSRSAYVGPDGVMAEPDPTWIDITDDGHPVAAVASTSPSLTDPLAAGFVAQAVRLAVRADHRQREVALSLAALEASRARLLGAADAERRGVALRVDREVLPHLRCAVSHVALVGPASGALATVGAELAGAERELHALVAGLPPTDLGDGRLVDAPRQLAANAAVATQVRAPVGWAAPAGTELALYYVAAEALSNALKHAAASHVVIELSAGPSEFELSVSDDGRGGADPGGDGLVGLADRVAVHRGRLTVQSPSSGGTRIVGTIPID